MEAIADFESLSHTLNFSNSKDYVSDVIDYRSRIDEVLEYPQYAQLLVVDIRKLGVIRVETIRHGGSLLQSGASDRLQHIGGGRDRFGQLGESRDRCQLSVDSQIRLESKGVPASRGRVQLRTTKSAFGQICLPGGPSVISDDNSQQPQRGAGGVHQQSILIPNDLYTIPNQPKSYDDCRTFIHFLLRAYMIAALKK
ncbi:hypothetical protein CR513_44176, partial [Mucuna pruriens]